MTERFAQIEGAAGWPRTSPLQVNLSLITKERGDRNLSTIFLQSPLLRGGEILPSIPDESRPASLVMAVTDF